MDGDILASFFNFVGHPRHPTNYGIMSTPDFAKPWFINCGGTLQIVTI